MTGTIFVKPFGAELTDDAPGDNRTDAALSERGRAYAQADALNWLLEGQQNIQIDEQPKPEENNQDGSFLKNAAKSVGEVTTQPIGGIRDAAQSMFEFADYMNKIAPTPSVQLFDEKGKLSPKFLSTEETTRRGEAGPLFNVPDIVGKPTTTAGSIARSITQFVAPFAAVGKIMGGIKAATTIGTFSRASTAGAITDFLAFPAHEERLSNLIQEFPALENPVNEWLAAEKDDKELEGRLKNAIEGLGLGTAAEGLLRTLKVYKTMRAAMSDKDGAAKIAEVVRTAERDQILREAADLHLLGSASENVPLTVDQATINRLRTAASTKMKAASKETEAGVPDDIVAKALTSKGLTPLEGADDIYINFARINAPEDIQKIINDTAQALSEGVNKSRRGVRSNVETVLSADKIDAWNVLLARRPGQALNAEQSVALRQLWATSADKLGQVAEIAAQNPTAENLFQFRRMLATHNAIQKEVIAARSEVARALQSWSIPVGGNLERMRDMASMLDRAGGTEAAEMLARRVALLAKTPDAAGALSKFTEKSVAAKTLGTIQEYWINALLSGPKTHMVNMMSNTGVVGMSLLERSIASRFGRLFSDEGVEIGEAAAQIAGLRGGILDAFRNAGRALRTGQTGFGVNKIEMPRERYISSGAWNVRSDTWAGRSVDALGTIVNVPGRLLQAEDEFFKSIGYRMELHAQAYRTATRELRAGSLKKQDFNKRVAQILDDPPEAIRMEATAMAAYQTFTSEPGRVTRWIQRGMIDYPALRFVLPFINTPSNILKYTFERTPLAPLSAKYRNAIARGGADADLARTKMALGTWAIMFAMDLAMNGDSTGSGPTNTAEKQNWRRQGYQPYSIKVGDRWYAYNRLDPLGYHLGIAADIAEYVLNAEAGELTAEETQEAMAAAVFAVAENITSKSYMQGLALLTEAVNDPDRFAASYFERFASSFVPSGVREVATFNDPVQRASHDIVSAIKRKIPGMSENLPARRDLWGREIRYQSGIGPAYDAVSPIYASGYKPEPIDLAMAKDGWYLGMGGYNFTVNGELVPLRNRPDIRNRYYQLRGGTKPSEMEAEGLLDLYGDKTLLEVLNETVQGEGVFGEAWLNARNADEREDVARKAFRDYGRFAKERLFAEFPWIEETAARLKKQRLAQ